MPEQEDLSPEDRMAAGNALRQGMAEHLKKWAEEQKDVDADD